MFKSRKAADACQSTTIIAREVRVVGDVHFRGVMHVEGTVEGTITADEEKGCLLTLSSGGCVRGEIRVPNAVIDGIVEGGIHCSQALELSAGARIDGDVHYKSLEMTAGAAVNGRMVHDAREPAQLTHVRAETEATPAEADIAAAKARA